MRRWEFMVLLSGTGWAAFSRGALAQPVRRVRRIGVLMSGRAADTQQQANMRAFVEAVQNLGWHLERDVVIDVRWGETDPGLMKSNAFAIVALKPDVILVQGVAFPSALNATRTIPLVFVLLGDPVGLGFVQSLSHPGGNATGFSQNAVELGGKWIEILKELAPDTIRVGFIFSSVGPVASKYLTSIETAARPYEIKVNHILVENDRDIDARISLFAKEPKGGLIINSEAFTLAHRAAIIDMAARCRVPAIYPFPLFISSGGLLSYGIDEEDQFRQAASYVDRILKGANPGDLPVQEPTRYKLSVNLLAAKALGIEIPLSLLAEADEVIE